MESLYLVLSTLPLNTFILPHPATTSHNEWLRCIKIMLSPRTDCHICILGTWHFINPISIVLFWTSTRLDSGQSTQHREKMQNSSPETSNWQILWINGKEHCLCGTRMLIAPDCKWLALLSEAHFYKLDKTSHGQLLAWCLHQKHEVHVLCYEQLCPLSMLLTLSCLAPSTPPTWLVISNCLPPHCLSANFLFQLSSVSASGRWGPIAQLIQLIQLIHKPASCLTSFQVGWICWNAILPGPLPCFLRTTTQISDPCSK